MTPNGVNVEEVLLAVGEIGYPSIVSASRMNKAVVVFVKEENQVNRLISSGILVSGDFITVSPLVAPTIKVTVSNVPPFIQNQEIERELLQHGKLASTIKTVPLGCKHEALKHLMSFRRHVFMFLNEQELDVSFRVWQGRAYMIYANTGNMKCFECGDIGHKRLVCPHKVQAVEEVVRHNEEVAVNDAANKQSVDVEDNEAQGVEEVVEEKEFQGAEEVVELTKEKDSRIDSAILNDETILMVANNSEDVENVRPTVEKMVGEKMKMSITVRQKCQTRMHFQRFQILGHK